jgi:hypothetical protein
VPVNKFFPVINLVLVLIIALLINSMTRIWTHPPYPARVDGSAMIGSPKNLQKLEVNKPGYNAGTVSQVVKSNLFRKERKQYVPPPPPPPPPKPTPKPPPKPALPPLPLPKLVLKGVLMLGGTKIAILQGKYSVRAGKKVVEKKLKKKGYSLGTIVGEFELTEIEKTSVTLIDDEGRTVHLRLITRAPNKIIHREGNYFFHKNKKYDARKFVATVVKRKPVRATTSKPPVAKPATAAKPAAAKKPITGGWKKATIAKPTFNPMSQKSNGKAIKFRVSGASTPVERAHISGR